MRQRRLGGRATRPTNASMRYGGRPGTRAGVRRYGEVSARQNGRSPWSRTNGARSTTLYIAADVIILEQRRGIGISVGPGTGGNSRGLAGGVSGGALSGTSCGAVPGTSKYGQPCEGAPANAKLCEKDAESQAGPAALDACTM